MDSSKKDNQILIKYTSILSVVEIALGSFLHSFKIPLSGHFLSLNQGFILTRASMETPSKNSAAIIGFSSALFKSLAPAGKKLTPMLAISTQGQLFSIGLYLAGNNFLGRLIGSVLLSLWAFIQPIGIYFLIFGKEIVDVINYFLEKLSEVAPVTVDNIFQILGALIMVKLCLSILVVILAHKISEDRFERYISWTKKLQTKKTGKNKKTLNPAKGALKDILSPLYLISIILSIVFFIFVDSKHSTSIWIILRPIAIGYFLFLAIRVFPIETITKRISNQRFKKIIEEVLLKIQN